MTGVGGGGINAGGQLSRNNSVIVDGASNDEQAVAGERGSFSLEAVREYVVYTNQFAAEYGQASGALVNVVTRSGTNNLNGRVFAFHRDDAFDAQNPFSKAQQSGKAPFSESRIGGFLGGPFARDAWHYFGSYEGLRNETTNVVTSPLVPVSEREFPRDDLTNQYFFKSEYRFTSNQLLSARYRLDDAHNNGQGIGGLNLIERGYDYTARHQDAVASFTSVISPRTVNELRVLYGRVHRIYSVDRFADPLGVTINRPSGNFGKASNMPQGWDSIRYQVSQHAVAHHRAPRLQDRRRHPVGSHRLVFPRATRTAPSPSGLMRRSTPPIVRPIRSSTRARSATGSTRGRTRCMPRLRRTRGAPPTC